MIYINLDVEMEKFYRSVKGTLRLIPFLISNSSRLVYIEFDEDYAWDFRYKDTFTAPDGNPIIYLAFGYFLHN